MSTESSKQASAKERYDLLYGSAKDLYWKLIELALKEAAILLVVLGWLLTAQSAQKMFASSVALRMGGTVVLILLTIFNGMYVRAFFHRSTAVHRKLDQLDYMPSEYHEAIKIPGSFAILICVTHFATSVIIIMTLWLTPFIVDPGRHAG